MSQAARKLPTQSLDAQEFSKFRLFEGVVERELAVLAQIMESVNIAAGEEFIKQDSKTNEIFFIQSGRVRVEISLVGGVRSEHIATLGPGESVGEFVLARSGRRTASASSVDAVTAFRCQASDLIKVFDENPRIGYVVYRNLTGVIVKRLEDTNMILRNSLV